MKQAHSALALSAALAVLSCASVRGATLVVTSLADDGSAGTLRALCASAADGDEIVFADALAGGTIAITTASGPIEISKTLSIVGPADAPVAIDGLGGANGARAYSGAARTTCLIHATDADSTLTLRNLVFTGSKANAGKDSAGNAAADVGPAVSILGAAVIGNCVWTNNAIDQKASYGTATGDGGACLRVAGDLTLANCSFVDNGINSSVCSIGGAVAALGERVSVSDCVFEGFYGWDGNKPGNSIRGGGGIGILGGDSAASKDVRIERCRFTDLWANAGAAAVFVRNDVAGGSLVFRDCVFRELRGYTANAYSSGGGALSYEGNGSPAFLVENCEFSSVATSGYGAAALLRGTGRSVFANCTFHHARSGSWGGAVDSRCNTYVVNCTFALGLSNQNNANTCGAVFMESRTLKLLNTVCAWCYKGNGAARNDVSHYGGTVQVVNSFNHPGDRDPGAEEMYDYDETTKMFAEPLAEIDSFATAGQTWTFANDVLSPVLTADEKAEKRDPAARRVVEILDAKSGGVLDRAGWPVKHSADWSSIAYTKDGGATWTALAGSVEDATILLLADSRGAAYPTTASGLPKPPIGSAAVIEKTPTMVLVK